MVLRAPGECRSLSGSQALMRGVSFLSGQVSIIGHEHTAHIGSRQHLHNEINDLMLQNHLSRTTATDRGTSRRLAFTCTLTRTPQVMCSRVKYESDILLLST
jgi:hypothetical protein